MADAADLSLSPAPFPAEDRPLLPRRGNRALTMVFLLLACAAVVSWTGAFLLQGSAKIAPPPATLFASALIGISNLAVAATLVFLIRRAGLRMAYFWAFVIFAGSAACIGLTYLLSAFTASRAPAWLGTIMQSLTGLASVATAVALPPLAPQLLSLVQSGRVADQRKRELEQQNLELMGLTEKLQLEIRERHKLEIRDSAHIQRLQSIVDYLPMGALVVDERNVILHINRECCDILRLEEEIENLIGMDVESFLRTAQKQVRNPQKYYDDTMRFLSERRQAMDYEFQLENDRLIRRDIIPVIVDESLQGYLFLYRDITKEKREDLGKTEFMSLASHQLRTPLTTIQWAFRRLEKSLGERVTPHDARLIQEGRSGARRMSHTIDTMLAISRIEAERLSLEIAEIKLGVILNEARADLRVLYERKKLQFTIDCQPNLLFLTDPFILKEILKNLFSNAIKYTPDGGAITVQGAMESGGIAIDVKDTGYGIPEAQQKRIFQKFFRADNAADKDPDGSGLGLYLVAKLVDLLHGTIAFTSAEGRGTTFFLRFPPLFYENGPAR